MVETFLEREVEGIIYASMYHREVNLPELAAGSESDTHLVAFAVSNDQRLAVRANLRPL